MTETAKDPLRFLLNGVETVTLNPAPDLTILEWLRNHRRLTGTKEGCAEGDCGACTVAIGEVDDGQLRFRAINACVAMTAQLHGKMLVTVEGLAQGKQLHPVQSAMVENHASQCGFCTPGFVMSLFARFHDQAPPELEEIHDTLAGNLCRCTGYRPIVDAAMQALGESRDDRFTGKIEDCIAELAKLDAPPTSVNSADGETFLPQRRAQLNALLTQHPQAVLLAGGTDLGLDVTKRSKRWPLVISLQNVEELNTISADDRRLRIGAAANYSDIMPYFARFGESAMTLLRRLGSTQIRNLGTMGGNIANASPIGDTPPLLLALGATLHIDGVNGERTIAIDDCFTGYRKTALAAGEYIASIEIPYPQDNEFFYTEKISRRFDQDISAVCGAFWLRLENGLIADARIAYGGMAARPERAAHAEKALAGAPFATHSFEAAARALSQDFKPISDFRASANYRMTTAQNLLRRLSMISGAHAGNAA